MSTHELSGRLPHHRVVVGWDQMQLTYFVQVHDTTRDEDDDSEEGNPVVWLGCTLRELYDLDDLKRALRPYADLPLELGATLYADRDEGR